jgi:hypothetical protein
LVVILLPEILTNAVVMVLDWLFGRDRDAGEGEK